MFSGCYPTHTSKGCLYKVSTFMVLQFFFLFKAAELESKNSEIEALNPFIDGLKQQKLETRFVHGRSVDLDSQSGEILADDDEDEDNV